jgi:hypothetical protein
MLIQYLLAPLELLRVLTIFLGELMYLPRVDDE